jgi:hypothetical protein
MASQVELAMASRNSTAPTHELDINVKHNAISILPRQSRIWFSTCGSSSIDSFGTRGLINHPSAADLFFSINIHYQGTLLQAARAG